MTVGRAAMAIGCGTGPERRHHAGRSGGGGADAGIAKRLADGANDQAAHQTGIAEAHIGLGRVDIDVDDGRIERQEQHSYRMPVTRQHVGEGATDGTGDQLVAHRPAVDIGILLQGICAREGRD